jgi:DNA-binding transcriptional ArsR family regulator
LRVLEKASLLVRQKNGRNRLCRLNAVPMKNATEWLDHYRRYWKHPSNATDGRERTPFQGSASVKPRQAQSSSVHSLAWLISFNFSVKFNQRALDATFSALADPTRRAILSCLAFADASVTELAAPFNISLPALTKHLRVLQAAGLIESQKYGRINLCRLVAAPMQNAEAWISRYRVFWERQLDALAEYLEKS